MDKTEADPKGLVRESYAIEGITIEECRSIFIDWVLSLGPQSDTNEALRALLVQVIPHKVANIDRCGCARGSRKNDGNNDMSLSGARWK